MESFWKKELVDGTIELGTDTMVSSGQASWTKGKQDIIQASIYFAGRVVCIRRDTKASGLVAWRQLDRNTWSVIEGRGRRTSRFLEVPVLGCPFLRRTEYLSSIPWTTFELNDRSGTEVPFDTKALRCEVLADGSLWVEYLRERGIQ